jgi:hypothetical protein
LVLGYNPAAMILGRELELRCLLLGASLLAGSSGCSDSARSPQSAGGRLPSAGGAALGGSMPSGGAAGNVTAGTSGGAKGGANGGELAAGGASGGAAGFSGGVASGGTTSASAGTAGASGGRVGQAGASAAAGAATNVAGADARAGASGDAGAGGEGDGPRTVDEVDVGSVWSGDPLFFALVTRGTHQFAAFYDGDRNMTVAARTLDQTAFTLVKLPSTVGWDSHNYVAMALDAANHVHVSGNMHGVPLVYFRTSAEFDSGSFEKHSMVGQNEDSVTYPVFFNGPTGDLIFEYRDGQSGDGNTIFDSYAATSETWTRLLDSPLLDGQGQRNAYPEGPVLGPDGYFHLVWVWRDTPDASTNHDLSYARSHDLVHWEAGDGRALTLPITLATSDIVDPVPVNSGMINNNTRVGFDLEARPVVSYHKFDAAGNTQLYAARLEAGAWVVHRMTDWNKRWDFGGGGTLVFQIEIDEGIRTLADGRIVQDVYDANLGGKVTLVLDDATLHATQTIAPALTPYPPELDTPVSSTAGMHVRWAADAGSGPDPRVQYMLRWETLDANGDQPRATTPPPTELKLYGFAP